MAENFKWCFIGTGTLAHTVARELKKHGGHEIVSVCSRRFEKAKEFAEKYGGTAYETAEKAITAPRVQGVYVVTPHNSHYEFVKKSIELGVPVLCEKPFTTDANQTKELFALAKEKGVYIAEAMWTWFGPVAKEVKKWVDGGKFGEIQNVHLNYHMNVSHYAPRLTDPNLAGGMLLDCGVYPLTYLYRLFGKPTEIKCEGVIKKGIDVREEIDLTFENGKTFRASMSMQDFKGLEKLTITGTKAELKLPFFHMAGKATLKGKGLHSEKVKGATNYINEFSIVAGEILAGKKECEDVPPHATIAVMEIMDECRKQMGLVYPFEK